MSTRQVLQGEFCIYYFFIILSQHTGQQHVSTPQLSRTEGRGTIEIFVYFSFLNEVYE